MTVKQRLALRYGAALLSVGFALALRLSLQPVIGERGVYTIFLLAVAAAAWSGGFGPALVATGLSVLVADWFLVPPMFSFGQHSVVHWVLQAIFIVAALLITAIVQRLSSTRDLLAREVDERRRIEEDVRCLNATLERRAEERTEDLRKKTALLTEAERISKVGSWELDIPKNEVSWSEELYRIYGLTPRQFRPSFEGFLSLLLPEDRGRIRTLHAETVRSGRPFEITHDIVRPDGARRTLHARGRVEMGPEGTPLRMYGTVQDVTERQALETRERAVVLKESRQRERLKSAQLEAVMESVPAAILITQDAEGRIIVGNTASYELLGMSPGVNISKSAPEGAPYDIYIDGRKAEASELPIQRSAATGRPILGQELEVRRADGELRWILVNAVPIFGEDGKVAQVVGAFVDVTGRKRAEDKVRELNTDLERRVRERTGKLEEVVRELEAFSYTVAHDLRAPLRAMKGFADLVIQDAGSRLQPEERDYLRRVIDSAGRMDALVHDLLAYSRLGRSGHEAERVALGSLIDEVVQQMGPELRAQRAELTVERGIPDVLGQAEILRQVVTNLLSNAAKFVEPGATPRIRVAAQTRDSWVRLTVEDNGIGIAPEYQGRIFKVFERLHRPELYPGTGIGLAIVDRAIEKMGGRLGVESELGKGSRFWFELPVASTGAPAAGEVSGRERGYLK